MMFDLITVATSYSYGIISSLAFSCYVRPFSFI